jgi:hypothetical protein
MFKARLVRAPVGVRTSIAALGLFVLVGCSQTWTLGALNRTGVALVIRITTDVGQQAWLLPDDGVALLRISETAASGWLELLDPVSCQLYDRARIPAESTVVAPFPVVANPGTYSLGLIEDQTSRRPADLPNFDGCTEA